MAATNTYTEISQEICSETAPLREKLRNLPYLLSHRKMFLLYLSLSFAKELAQFLLIMFIVGLVSGDVIMLMKGFVL